MSETVSLCWALAFIQALVPALIIGIAPLFQKRDSSFEPGTLDRVLGGVGLAGVAWVAFDVMTQHRWTIHLTWGASILLLAVDIELIRRLWLSGRDHTTWGTPGRLNRRSRIRKAGHAYERQLTKWYVRAIGSGLCAAAGVYMSGDRLPWQLLFGFTVGAIFSLGVDTAFGIFRNRYR